MDTFLYGRRVWEMMSGYWPTAESVSDYGRPGDRLNGGAELAAELAKHCMIEDYHVAVHPVVLAGGKQVFPVTERLNLTFGARRCTTTG